ncbi:hypothetical protein BJ741DRAFT_588398 [Chytriomyces cf. hyalinus JEL632]|nr:hypothetical protein BJ741DRAFT_588398 [Chytriomyces cf. hyalinus JEL632]
MDDLFVIDRKGATPAPTVFVGATSSVTFSHIQTRPENPKQPRKPRQPQTLSTTRAFSDTPRQEKRKKGKGKFKGPRKHNFGFEAEGSIAGIDWRGPPPADPSYANRSLSEDQETIRDFMENMDMDGIGTNVSLLADMRGSGVGGLDSDSEEVIGVEEQQEIDSDSDSDSDEDPHLDAPSSAKTPKKKEALPESGFHESLTKLHDANVLVDLSVDSNSDESSEDEDGSISESDAIDISAVRIEGDSDGDECTQKGLRKKKYDGFVEFPVFEDDGQFVRSGAKTLSGKGRKKQKLLEKKLKRGKDANLLAALKEEQIRIAHHVAKKKKGDAISPELIQILHRINKTMYEFVQANPPSESIQLPPMAQALRNLSKDMAVQYGLVPRVRGSHGEKRVILNRSGHRTRVPADWKNVVGRVVSQNKGILKGNTWSGKKDGGSKLKRPPGAPDDRAVPRPGDVVGDGAAPVGEDNLGHKMMLLMGWTPGAGLGSGNRQRGQANAAAPENDGAEGMVENSSFSQDFGSPAVDAGVKGASIETSVGSVLMEPITVTVRSRHRGLGFE